MLEGPPENGYGSRSDFVLRAREVADVVGIRGVRTSTLPYVVVLATLWVQQSEWPPSADSNSSLKDTN